MIPLKRESRGQRDSPAGFESIWLAKKIRVFHNIFVKRPNELYDHYTLSW